MGDVDLNGAHTASDAWHSHSPTEVAWRVQLRRVATDAASRRAVARALKLQGDDLEESASLESAVVAWLALQPAEKRLLALAHQFGHLRQTIALPNDKLDALWRLWVCLVVCVATRHLRNLAADQPRSVGVVTLPSVDWQHGVVMAVASFAACGCRLEYGGDGRLQVVNVIARSTMSNIEAAPPGHGDAWVKQVADHAYAWYLRTHHGRVASGRTPSNQVQPQQVKGFLELIQEDGEPVPVFVDDVAQHLALRQLQAVYTELGLPCAQDSPEAPLLTPDQWFGFCSLVRAIVEDQLSLNEPTKPNGPSARDAPHATPGGGVTVNAGPGSQVTFSTGHHSPVNAQQIHSGVTADELAKAFDAFSAEIKPLLAAHPEARDAVEDIKAVVIAKDDGASGKKLLERSVDRLKKLGEGVDAAEKLRTAGTALYDQAVKYWPLVEPWLKSLTT